MRGWTIQDAIELYDVHAWGAGFVSVNEQGRVEIRPRGNGGPGINLYELTLYLRARGLELPLLIRFSDIVADRISSICEASPAPSRSTSTRAATAALPDQGEPAAPRGGGDRRLRPRLELRARGRLQAGAAGAPAVMDDAGGAHHLQRLQGPRVHRDRAARAEARPHADHRARAHRGAGPRAPGVARSWASGRTSACAPSSPRRASGAGRTRPATAQVRPHHRRDGRGRRSPAAERDARLPAAPALPHRQPDLQHHPDQETRCRRRRTSTSSWSRWAPGSSTSTSAAAWPSTTTARRPTSTRP